jgi:hypothetical protein
MVRGPVNVHSRGNASNRHTADNWPIAATAFTRYRFGDADRAFGEHCWWLGGATIGGADRGGFKCAD